MSFPKNISKNVIEFQKNSSKSAVNPVFISTSGFTTDFAEFTNSAKSVVNPAVLTVVAANIDKDTSGGKWTIISGISSTYV